MGGSKFAKMALGFAAISAMDNSFIPDIPKREYQKPPMSKATKKRRAKNKNKKTHR